MKSGFVAHPAVYCNCVAWRLALSRNGQVLHPSLIKPASPLVRSMQFRRLVDIDLAGLLGMSLAELLALVVVIQTSFKDPALAGEISGTIQPKTSR